MDNKKFCPTHRFSYSEDKCPFCEKDRLNTLSKKYNNK